MIENSLELLAEGLGFPEGPIICSDGSVLLVEIRGGCLSRIAPDGSKTVVAITGGGPNGAAVGPDGAVYITNNGRAFEFVDMPDGLVAPGHRPPEHQGGSIQRVDLATGDVTTLYDSCDGRRLIGPNDLVFDAAGGMWFTDHGCSTADGRLYGALYYATIDGKTIVNARDHFVSPNGVGLSPDGKTVYMSDSFLCRLWAFEIEGPGKLAAPSGPFEPGRVVKNLDGIQLLDSLAVDAAGNICVATVVNGGITIFSPQGQTSHVAIPDYLTTNICFGGEDMRDAYITAAGTGRLYKARWATPGLKLEYNI